jgi:hypothetical protein
MLTPYIDETGGYSIPVSQASYLEARRAAKSLAAEVLGSDFKKLVYEGRKIVSLTDHEVGCTCGKRGCNQRREECWVFYA